jgi:corrinoid protein of di/trimethylamine methyltransferase
MSLENMLLKELEKAVLNYDAEKAKEAAKKVIELKINPLKAIEDGLAKGIRIVGEKFHKNEIYLPHLVMAADAMIEAIKVLESVMSKEQIKSARKGVIVLGTVKGDIHDIGKNIVGSMLRASGFEVHDIGKDVPIEKFVEKALEVNANIIGASALMTITMPAQKELIEELERRGLRSRFKVMVGGGCISKEWAKEIGADGFGRDAEEAVKVAEELVAKTIRGCKGDD